MEQRATDFVEAMVVVAVIGVLAFLIGLLARAPLGRQASGHSSPLPTQSPRWYEFTLALILLAAIAAFAVWLISSGRQWAWGETIGDWRSDTHAIIFAAVMVALGIAGLAVSLAYTLVQASQPPESARPRSVTAETAPATSAVAAAPTPSPIRLLGLLGLILAVLLLCWIALSPVEQYGLVAQLLYPGSLGVSLVLLFDKAARAWSVKRGAETVREWLLCDLLVFLLVLSFLHLRSLAKPEAYASTFWDILNITLLFLAFWLIDRTAARGRFLVGYGYLVLLPLLLLIWDTVQGVAAAATWWASAWPFLILAGVFLILEVITLVASTSERQILPTLKDALFVLMYAILLIIAVKSHG